MYGQAKLYENGVCNVSLQRRSLDHCCKLTMYTPFWLTKALIYVRARVVVYRAAIADGHEGGILLRTSTHTHFACCIGRFHPPSVSCMAPSHIR